MDGRMKKYCMDECLHQFDVEWSGNALSELFKYEKVKRNNLVIMTLKFFYCLFCYVFVCVCVCARFIVLFLIQSTYCTTHCRKHINFATGE